MTDFLSQYLKPRTETPVKDWRHGFLPFDMPVSEPVSPITEKPISPVSGKFTPYQTIPAKQVTTGEESKSKDLWDALYLGFQTALYGTEQGLFNVLPRAVVSNIFPEGIVPEEYLTVSTGKVTPKIVNPQFLPGQKPAGMSMENVASFNFDETGAGTLGVEPIKGLEIKRPEVIQGLMNTMEAGYQEKQRQFKAWLNTRPDLAPRPEYMQNPFEHPELFSDPYYYIYTIASNAVPITAALGTAVIVTGTTGNPVLGAYIGAAVITPMEINSVYEDLIANGANPEEAANLASSVGALIGSVEIVPGIIALKAIAPLFMRAFKTGLQKELTAQVVKKLSVKGLLLTASKIEIAETLEEVIQQAMQNAAVQTVNKNRSLIEGLDMAAVQAAISTLPLALFGAGGQYAAMKKNLPQATQQKINELKATFVQAGLTEDHAEAIAITRIQETESGKKQIDLASLLVSERGGGRFGKTQPTPQAKQPVARTAPPAPKPELTREEFIPILNARVKAVQEARRAEELAEKYGSKEQKIAAKKARQAAEDIMGHSQILEVALIRERRNIAALSTPQPSQAKQPWQMTVQEYKQTVVPTLKGDKLLQAAFTQDGMGRPSAHKRAVQQALASNKPVPPEVLKDYPDLKAPVTTGVEKIYYHGARTFFTGKPRGDIAYVSESKYTSEMYGGNIREFTISPEAKILKYDDLPKEIKHTVVSKEKKSIEYARKEGYDGVEILQNNNINVAIWNKDILETTQPLTPTEAPKAVPEPSTKPTTAPQVNEKAPVTQEAIKPPSEPPTKPPIDYGSNEPIKEPNGKVRFAPLQDAQTVIDIATKPDLSREIANLPGLKQIMGSLNPSAIAGTPAEKALILRAVLRDEATQKAQGIISYLNELGSQEKIFGKLDDKGFIKSGELKGKSVNGIRTYPNRYKLTDKQKQWIKRANEIEEAKLKYLRDNEIEVRELSFEEGGQYAGRIVFARIASDGELMESAYVGAGPGRVGGKISAEKARIFKTADEAMKEGFRYLPDDEALSINVRSACNKVADKQMSDWFLTQVNWRTTGAPDELILAAEGAGKRLRKSEQLLAAMNRANRGEKLPTVTINSIASAYPNEAKELQSIIDKKQAGKSIIKDVKDLRAKAKALIDSSKADWNAAVNARARAREKAMTPHYGEAMVMHPAFQGKIFTDPDAKKIADTLRKGLEPDLNKALQSVNKVNALVRYFKLAGDFSTMLIQLLFLAGQNPIIYGKAGAAGIITMFDQKFHAKILTHYKDIIDRHPNLILSSMGNEFTEALSKGGLFREGPMKVAGVVLGLFQRFFETSIDYAGLTLAEGLEHMAKNPKDIADLDQFINEFRGLASSAKLGVKPNWRAIETAILLAPRYNRAIAALLFDAIKGTIGVGHAGLRAKLARDSLAKGILAIIAVWVAAGFAAGKDWDEIKETLNPADSKFLTYTIGGVNIGPGSKVRSVIMLFGKISDNPESILQFSMENPALRFARGNLAPVLGTGIDVLLGKNYIGDPTRDSWGNFAKENILTQFLPIWVENVVYEGGSLSERLIRGAGEFFGGRAYPETTWDEVSRLRDRYTAQDYGLKYEELNNSQKDELKRKYPDLAELEKKAQEESAIKGSDIERFYILEKKRITDARNNALELAAKAYLEGRISKYEYDKQRAYIRPYYSGGSEVLWSAKESLDAYSVNQLEKWLDENEKPEDKDLGEYQQYRAELIEGADLPVDWDLIEQQLKIKLSTYSPEIQQYITENLNNWINDLPEAARKVEEERATGIEDESWWQNYRGSSPGRASSPFGIQAFPWNKKKSLPWQNEKVNQGLTPPSWLKNSNQSSWQPNQSQQGGLKKPSWLTR